MLKIAIPLLIMFSSFLLAQEVDGRDDEGVSGAQGISISIERAKAKEGRIEVFPCPYCGKRIQPGHIHREGEQILLNQLKDALDSRGIAYIENERRGSHLHLYVFRFIERQGGNMAIERPASVGFHLHLLEHDKVREVFVFDEEQRPLLENIFGIGKFFKRGMKWVTADVLSEEGIEKGVDTLKEFMK
ncbi:MAG: hypothetical protein N2745_09270 [Syntrophorhabdaceae bacterium]|nr:hypothetical protein [Syntrophorhabdaceae bacterium]